MTLDLVYLVRPGNNNPELRMSLRSLKNFPHGKVWIVGHKPNWVANVRHIKGNPTNNSHANVFLNVLAACEHPDTPDEFVIMNDDFYITRPIQKIPNWYRSTLTEHME
ncbi:MAG TPA: hypothetical protein PK890_08770, partial [Terrimesophilobacter sp.]|nr:hypothetical protein [Terrimesophilobacter sp.]